MTSIPSDPFLSSDCSNKTEKNIEAAEIFLSKMKDQAEFFKNCVEKFKANSYSSLDIKKLIEFAQLLIEAGKAIKSESIIQLGLALEIYFSKIKEAKVDNLSQVEPVLQLVLNFLNELYPLPADHLHFFITERKYFLDQLIMQLLNENKTLDYSLTDKEKINKNNVKKIEIDPGMFDLFKSELETQGKTLAQNLIELEQKPASPELLESLMRAAHSIKGAARVVNLTFIVRLAHAIEDCFVAAQNQKITLSVSLFDQLLKSIDFLSYFSKIKMDEIESWLDENLNQVEELTFLFEKSSSEKIASPTTLPSVALSLEEIKQNESLPLHSLNSSQERVLRMTAQNLNRLIGLAGESLVESQWLLPFVEKLQKFKNNLNLFSNTINILRENNKKEKLTADTQFYLNDLHYQTNEMRHDLSKNLEELDDFIRRHAHLSDQLYQEMLNSRMRPFADGVENFSRIARDLSHQLGKKVKIEIEGKSTLVDRDILEKLKAPLTHLLRNSIDHGIETPADRKVAGKLEEGLIKFEAHHHAGMLAITVTDDGRGIDIQKMRQKIVEKNLVSKEIAQQLTDIEIADYVFLPGFSTSSHLNEISGRGVGLNIVQSTVKEIGGSVEIETKPGKGVRFHLQLPLTLSVIRALLVEISGEIYALPLARLSQTLFIEKKQIQVLNNEQFFYYNDQLIKVVEAWQLLNLNPTSCHLSLMPIIIINSQLKYYGLIVDRLIGEKELVIQELDTRLKKIPSISAGSIMEEGSPLLMIDVENLFLSTDKKTDLFSSKNSLLIINSSKEARKKQENILKNQGYLVDTAFNSLDGWNAIQLKDYQLIIIDVKMPLINEINLLKAIKKDLKYKKLPVLLIADESDLRDSLKDLKVGFDYFLLERSFQENQLIDLVRNCNKSNDFS